MLEKPTRVALTPEKLDALLQVLRPARTVLLDGRPVEFATSYLPLALARNTPIAQPNPGPGGIYARLEELGHRLDHFDEEIRALIDTAVARAHEILSNHRDALERLARALIKDETLEGESLDRVFREENQGEPQPQFSPAVA